MLACKGDVSRSEGVHAVGFVRFLLAEIDISHSCEVEYQIGLMTADVLYYEIGFPDVHFAEIGGKEVVAFPEEVRDRLPQHTLRACYIDAFQERLLPTLSIHAFPVVGYVVIVRIYAMLVRIVVIVRF